MKDNFKQYCKSESNTDMKRQLELLSDLAFVRIAGFAGVVLSEPLGDWHADSNHPVISDYMRLKCNSSAARIILLEEFIIK